MTMEARGTAFGWSHTVVTDLPGGNLRYEITYRLRKGADKTTEVEVNGSWVVDRELRPISFTIERRDDQKQERSEGLRNGAVMTLTTREHNGRERRRTIRIRDVYFDCVVEDLIYRRKEQRRFRVRTIDSNTLRFGTLRVQIGNTLANAFEATVRDGKESTVYRFARDGQVLEILLPVAGIRGRLSTAEEARKARTTINQAFLAEIRSRNPFPNPFNLVSGRVRVHWIRTKPSKLILVDNRQTIIRTRRSPVGYEAVLDLGAAPPLSASSSGRRPQGAFLANDRHVQPGNPAIRNKASEIVGTLKDNVEIVRTLLTWVRNYIHFENREDIWTGPQILESRTGRCAEYAVLFASLARAAGIPTRMAIGVAYHDGLWGGHMWNEVWLGKWVAVDATRADRVTGPTYVKFKDDATVDGVMHVRSVMSGMSIDVLEYLEDRPNPKLKTGIDGSIYVNSSFHCRIAAPAGSWVLEESRQDNGSPLLVLKPAQGGEVFSLSLTGIPSELNAAAVLDLHLKALASSAPKMSVIGRGELKIAGRTALRATVAQPTEDAIPQTWNYAVLVERNSAYIFSWKGGDGAQDKASCRILTSFDLLP
jgi:hypothetical protein